MFCNYITLKIRLIFYSLAGDKAPRFSLNIKISLIFSVI
jgi:hypothetical protein